MVKENTQTITLRLAESNDLHRLLEFAEHTFRYAFEDDNDPVYFEQYCQTAFTLKQFVAEMEHVGSEFWLAELEGELVGYIKLNYDETVETIEALPSVQVERLYISPSFQNKGIGNKLMLLAQKRAVEKNAEWIWLSVWQENPNALRFYQRFGFTIFATTVFHVGDDPQVDWLVRKKVSTAIH